MRLELSECRRTHTDTLLFEDPLGKLFLEAKLVVVVSSKGVHIAWVGVSWQGRCKARQSLRELDKQGTAFFSFFFLAVAVADGRVRSFARGGEA